MKHPFETAVAAPRDPIAGVTDLFHADMRTNKQNLGVGVYTDAAGRIPVLAAVRSAQQALHAQGRASGYLPIDGLATYNEAVQRLVLGDASPAVRSGRVVTVQTPGGTGALRLGADLLRCLQPLAGVWISAPTWENHRSIFATAGFAVSQYPYYDPKTHGVDEERLLQTLDSAPAGAIVVLHACCHNPTGADLSLPQWQRLAEVMQRRGLVPFLDLAYQGFGEGLDADAMPVRLMVEAGLPVLVASSFSKNLSLYGERVGALTVVGADTGQAERLRSQLKQLARSNYSNPPLHGAQIAQAVLTDPALRKDWEEELGRMRERVVHTRSLLANALRTRGWGERFDFIERQCGIFSYLDVPPQAVQALRETHAIYMLDTGRACIAAIRPDGIEPLAQALTSVLDRATA